MTNPYEKIESYLLGELADDELQAFEAALRTDEALVRSVAQHREVMARLNALRLRNKVKSAIYPSLPSPSPITLQHIVSVALMLALGMAAIWFFTRPGKEPAPAPTPVVRPPASEATPPVQQPNAPATQVPNIPARPIAWVRSYHVSMPAGFVREVSESHAEKSPATLAATAYAQQDYPQVIRHLATLDPADEEGLALRANACFLLGRYTDSARDFRALEKSFQFKHEARWNFLLCQILLGNDKEATIQLDQMLAEPDFPFLDKAKALKAKW